MSSSWTIEYDGTTQSLAAWGIATDSARCVFRSLAADEFSFRIPTADALADPTFPYGATIKLRKDSTIWFVGKVARVQAVGNSHNESNGYIVLGPWDELERLAYQQVRAIATEDFSDTDHVFTTIAVLGQSVIGTRMLTSEVIAKIVAFAIAKGVAITAGTIADGIAFPYAETRDLSCAAAITQMARRTPDCVSWFDYSSGTPELNIARRASLASATLDLTAGSSVRDWSVTAREDLVPPGVRFTFLNNRSDPATSIVYCGSNVYDAGNPDAVGSIVATIELTGNEAIPENLAGEYYDMLSVTPYEGGLSTMEQDCAGTLRPGVMLNLSNGQTAWATMNAIIQEVVEDLNAGLTTITYGPPEHLGPQDWVEQVLFNRRSGVRAGVAEVKNPTVIDSGEGYDPNAESDSEAQGYSNDANQAEIDLAQALQDLAQAVIGGDSGEIATATAAVAAAKAALTAAQNGGRRDPNPKVGSSTNLYFAGVFGTPVDITVCEDGESSTVRVMTPP